MEENEIELTRGQESCVNLLDGLDEEKDDKKINSVAEAYKFIKEGDAKESEQAREWTRMYMEDERKKQELRIEEKKIDNDYKIRRAELMNDRVKDITSLGKTAVVGVTMVGVSKVAVDTVIDIEKNGVLTSNPLSKEVISKVFKTPIEWVMKLIFH